MDLTEKTVSSEMIYQGKVVNLRIDTIEFEDGRTATREVVEHRGAVAIVPLTDVGSVLMIRQYRRAVDEILLEIPAGTLEPDEPIEACALRELEEETGFVASKIRHLFSQYLAPGYSQEVLHVFLAEDLKLTQQNMDEDENMEVVEYQLSEIDDMIRDGQIKDAKTIAGLLMTMRLLGK